MRVFGLIGSVPLHTHVVFGLVFLGSVLVGSHVCVFRHGVRHLRLAMQSQSVRKLAVDLKKLILKYEQHINWNRGFVYLNEK